MSDMPSAVTAQLRGDAGHPVAGVLIELEFSGGTQRVWNGAHELATSDGKTWDPVWKYGRVSSVEQSTATEAPPFRVEIRSPGLGNNLTDADFTAAFRAALDEDVFGRGATVYLQVFDPSDWSTINAPQAIAAGLMTVPSADWGDAKTAVAAVQVEHVLAWAGRPPHAFLTDADQQARESGDKICEFVTVLPRREVTWPRD